MCRIVSGILELPDAVMQIGHPPQMEPLNALHESVSVNSYFHPLTVFGHVQAWQD